MVRPRAARNDRLSVSGFTVSSNVGVGPVREAFEDGVSGRFVQNRTQSRKLNEISGFRKRPFAGVAERLTLWRAGCRSNGREGPSPATPSPDPILGQILRSPGARAKVNRWRAVSCAVPQDFAYHALVRAALIQKYKNRLIRTAFPSRSARLRMLRTIITWRRICCSTRRAGNQEEGRALFRPVHAAWSLMSFAAGRLSDR